MSRKNTIPKRADHLLERDLGDATVVLSQDGKELHTFDGTANFLWKKIDGRRSFDQILRELIEQYDVAPEVAERDFEIFLGDLEKINIIKI